MKRKYLLTILLALLLFQGVLHMEGIRKERALARSQEAYEALQELAPDRRPSPPPAEESPSPVEEEPPAGYTWVRRANPYDAYYRINPDYQGWLEVPGTRIDYPVVRGKDNTFYLDRNFQKEKDILGSVFMDYRNVGMGIDTHTIIYGHYTRTGAMFGELDRYLSKDYLEANPEFTFTDPHTTRRYRIFSVHVSPSEGSMIQMVFKEGEYAAFLTMLKERSAVDLGAVSVGPDQKILSLITCNYAIRDGRLFIHAVEILD